MAELIDDLTAYAQDHAPNDDDAEEDEEPFEFNLLGKSLATAQQMSAKPQQSFPTAPGGPTPPSDPRKRSPSPQTIEIPLLDAPSAKWSAPPPETISPPVVQKRKLPLKPKSPPVVLASGASGLASGIRGGVKTRGGVTTRGMMTGGILRGGSCRSGRIRRATGCRRAPRTPLG